MELSDFTVETDESLIPFAEIKNQTGVVNLDPMRTFTFPGGTIPAMLTISKSFSSVEYRRKFERFDEFLAYFGGLLSSIIGVIIIMHAYNKLCYLVNLGTQLLTDNQGNKIN